MRRRALKGINRIKEGGLDYLMGGKKTLTIEGERDIYT